MRHAFFCRPFLFVKFFSPSAHFNNLPITAPSSLRQPPFLLTGAQSTLRLRPQKCSPHRFRGVLSDRYFPFFWTQLRFSGNLLVSSSLPYLHPAPIKSSPVVYDITLTPPLRQFVSFCASVSGSFVPLLPGFFCLRYSRVAFFQAVCLNERFHPPPGSCVIPWPRPSAQRLHFCFCFFFLFFFFFFFFFFFLSFV